MSTSDKEAQETVLRLDGITKRFGALTANDSISLTLNRGEIVALLGENGAGKTTLMNILFGHYTADEGTVEVFGTELPPGRPRAALAAGVGMVHQHFTLAEHLSVAENIVLGTAPLFRLSLGLGAARKRIRTLAGDFGLRVDPDARVSTLSVGEKQRVEILKALYRNARILILDEPTAVLTPQETDALFATLKRAVAIGLSIVFISHKLHEVMAVADRCVVLRHGKVVAERQTSATSARELASLMVGGDVPELAPSTAKPGRTIFALRNVSTPDREGAPGLKRVTLELKAGQITGLAGVSGNGQTDISDLVAGLASPGQGSLHVEGTVPLRWTPEAAVSAGIARIPEDRHKTGTIADFSLTENAILETYHQRPFSRAGWMNRAAAEYFTQHIIDTYDVRCPGPDTRIRLLSGGNMQKLILGRVLEPGPHVILANQPVRGLDIGAITFVHSRLIAARDAGAAVLLISEDLDEVQRLSDVIHVVYEGRLSPGFARGSLTTEQLGLWMTGQGFDHAA